MAESLKITRQGKGIPLVLLHGWGLNSGVWESLKGLLPDNIELITVDLPGFGLNVEQSLSEYQLINVAKKIQLSIKVPAIYLGWSLGGLVANQIALAAPDKVLGVVNVSSSPCFVEKEGWPGIKADVLALFHQQLAQDTQKTISNFLNIQAMGSPNLRHDVKALKRMIMQYSMPSRKTLDEALKLLEDVDLREQIAQIKAPSLYLFGKLDTLVPRKAIPLIQKLSPLSKIYLFEKSSHAPFISHQDEFIKVLNEWLKALNIKC